MKSELRIEQLQERIDELETENEKLKHEAKVAERRLINAFQIYGHHTCRQEDSLLRALIKFLEHLDEDQVV